MSYQDAPATIPAHDGKETIPMRATTTTTEGGALYSDAEGAFGFNTATNGSGGTVTKGGPNATSNLEAYNPHDDRSADANPRRPPRTRRRRSINGHRNTTHNNASSQHHSKGTTDDSSSHDGTDGAHAEGWGVGRIVSVAALAAAALAGMGGAALLIAGGIKTKEAIDYPRTPTPIADMVGLVKGTIEAYTANVTSLRPLTDMTIGLTQYAMVKRHGDANASAELVASSSTPVTEEPASANTAPGTFTEQRGVTTNADGTTTPVIEYYTYTSRWLSGAQALSFMLEPEGFTPPPTRPPATLPGVPNRRTTTTTTPAPTNAPIYSPMPPVDEEDRSGGFTLALNVPPGLQSAIGDGTTAATTSAPSPDHRRQVYPLQNRTTPMPCPAVGGCAADWLTVQCREVYGGSYEGSGCVVDANKAVPAGTDCGTCSYTAALRKYCAIVDVTAGDGAVSSPLPEDGAPASRAKVRVAFSTTLQGCAYPYTEADHEYLPTVQIRSGPYSTLVTIMRSDDPRILVELFTKGSNAFGLDPTDDTAEGIRKEGTSLLIIGGSLMGLALVCLIASQHRRIRVLCCGLPAEEKTFAKDPDGAIEAAAAGQRQEAYRAKMQYYRQQRHLQLQADAYTEAIVAEKQHHQQYQNDEGVHKKKVEDLQYVYDAPHTYTEGPVYEGKVPPEVYAPSNAYAPADNLRVGAAYPPSGYTSNTNSNVPAANALSYYHNPPPATAVGTNNNACALPEGYVPVCKSGAEEGDGRHYNSAADHTYPSDSPPPPPHSNGHNYNPNHNRHGIPHHQHNHNGLTMSQSRSVAGPTDTIVGNTMTLLSSGGASHGEMGMGGIAVGAATTTGSAVVGQHTIDSAVMASHDEYANVADAQQRPAA